VITLSYEKKRHRWRNWRVVQTSSGVYLCRRTTFWTFICRPNANVCLCFYYHQKNQV